MLRDRYGSIRFRKELFGEEPKSVPLGGVAQIPDDVVQTIYEDGEFALSREQMLSCDRAITEAALEIRRRHEARKARIPVEQYFPRTAEQDDS